MAQGDLLESHEGIPSKEASLPQHGNLFIVRLEVRVMTTDYLRKVVSNFPETIQERLATPAADHLFTVR